MTDNNTICPNCGEPMLATSLDGSFSLDGSTDLTSTQCPKCSTTGSECDTDK